VGRLRDFFGFNRAKHAVVEAAILATRTQILPAAEIEAEYRRLAVLVDKTGGEQEHTAFAFLRVRHRGGWPGGRCDPREPLPPGCTLVCCTQPQTTPRRAVGRTGMSG
jgi:hypothetical protein